MASTACCYCGAEVELSADARARLRWCNELQRARGAWPPPAPIQPSEVAVCENCLPRWRLERAAEGRARSETLRRAWLDFVRHEPGPGGHGGPCCGRARAAAGDADPELESAAADWIASHRARTSAAGIKRDL